MQIMKMSVSAKKDVVTVLIFHCSRLMQVLLMNLITACKSECIKNNHSQGYAKTVPVMDLILLFDS